MLDEPTTGLDPETRRQLWDIVQGESGGGRAIVITTHSMEEADTLCSRIGIMAKGMFVYMREFEKEILFGMYHRVPHQASTDVYMHRTTSLHRIPAAFEEPVWRRIQTSVGT